MIFFLKDWLLDPCLSYLPRPAHGLAVELHHGNLRRLGAAFADTPSLG